LSGLLDGGLATYRPARGNAWPSTGVRVGVDICSVSSVAKSIETFGDRYLRRIYTDAELEYAGDVPAPRAERLAARFAAKEATVKVLRPSGVVLDWRSIEVRKDPQGWTELALGGEAARLAATACVSAFSLSLSHDDGMAVAVVIALLSERPEEQAPTGSRTQ
jgi:holo-[acyl-carrier protein] synthase